MKRKGRAITKRGLIKKLDKVFSLYIRTKYADQSGYVRCYTCDAVKPINQMQCGHFISRACYIYRWDERHIKPQCPSCNLFHSGRLYEFGKKLEKELGESVVEVMVATKGRPSEFSQRDYLDMIDHYTERLDRMNPARNDT